MLIFKKSSYTSIFNRYDKGSFFKIKPNNKRVYSLLEKMLKCKVKNAYNLLDCNGESVGILCCKIINTESLGGVQVIFLPLGEDGFYDLDTQLICFNACFKNLSIENDNFWYYESNEIPSYLKESFKYSDVLCGDKKYTVLSLVKGKKAAPKIIVRTSNAIKSFYENEFGITSAFNTISFNDI